MRRRPGGALRQRWLQVGVLRAESCIACPAGFCAACRLVGTERDSGYRMLDPWVGPLGLSTLLPAVARYN